MNNSTELKINFAKYFDIVNETVSRFDDEYKQIVERQQSQNTETIQTNMPNDVIVN